MCYPSRASIATGILAIGLIVGAASNASADSSAQILSQITPAFSFHHPGGLNSLSELEKIHDNIIAGREPWKSNFARMQASVFAKRDYTPHPVAEVGIGKAAYDEITDSEAAYTQALLWVLTREEWHAQKAAQIIDGWSDTLTSHPQLNWYLQTAWVGAMQAEAAEILRATYPQWHGADRLAKHFGDLFLPLLHNRLAFGNREFAVCNALVAIGVFNNDIAAFYEGINHWLSYTPTYFYIAEDGAIPKAPNYWVTSPTDEFLKRLDAERPPLGGTSWIDLGHEAKKPGLGDDSTMLLRGGLVVQWHNPGTYTPGYTPETGGRDLTHAEGALLAAVNVAEIAWHQGIDLYSMAAPRLTASMETLAALRLGEPISSAAYGGVVNPGSGVSPTYEIAYNHLHNVMGIDLPITRQLIDTVIRQMGPLALDRPFPPGIPSSLRANRIWNQSFWNANWETLTHAELDAH